MSTQSRNHHVGVELGKGRALTEIIDEMHMVAEGVKSSSVVSELAEASGIEMPIAEEVRAVCHDGKAVGDALVDLLQRRAGREAD